jgi:hypothetical protein
MTVEELKDRMSFDELVGWAEWFEWKHKQQEDARRKAKQERATSAPAKRGKPAGRRR